MPERPLLIFPKPEPVSKPKGRGGGSQIPVPTNKTGQAERIEQQFAQIQAAFVSDEPRDVERVLVMETSSRIDGLQNAVNKIPGLEWLAEMDVDDIELHDLYDEETGKKVKGGRFYLLSSNKQATDRLLGLWNQCKAGQTPAHGFGKFKEVFQHLITLRRWDIRDRLRDTGILDVWKEEFEIKKGTDSHVDFEIELHYSKDEIKRNKRLNEIQAKVENAGGNVGQSICMEDIAFHALKASLPIDSIENVIGHNWDAAKPTDEFSPVFDSEAVRHFRPIGQQIDAEGELPEHQSDITLEPVDDKPPVLALLDGAPMLRHTFLNNRIDFYDPDKYQSAYEPSQQKHGTAMASLICHGDLSRSQTEITSLTRRIYVRPVMKPNPVKGYEQIPLELFQEDIIERAVREMFEGDAPAAPGVRVINVSLGNIQQQYLNEMSPWARLLDWLSFKYKVLFIVSAGNYLASIRLADSDGESLDGDEETSRQHLLKGIDENQRNHRLLSPAESMNALTVGALQGDSSGTLSGSIRGIDPIEDMNLPSPYSRVGSGYRNAIKPEIFVQGGRLLYDKDPIEENLLRPLISNDPPGVQAACPGTRPEILANTSHQAGTSNAAAIASHGAGHIFEMLEELRDEHADIMSADFDAVLLKTLLVHSASQGENGIAYEHLRSPTNSMKFKRYLSKYIGYGNINIGKVLECTRTRATAVGCGSISERQRHRFIFPLPAGGSVRDYLRLSVTLAWFSPINSFHIGLRRAKLFFDGNVLKGTGGHERQETDWQQVSKGTVQHEIFELNKNRLPGDNLELFVECAADAGTLDDEILYGLAVTLEVAEQENIDLYQIIKQGIRQPVRV